MFGGGRQIVTEVRYPEPAGQLLRAPEISIDQHIDAPQAGGLDRGQMQMLYNRSTSYYAKFKRMRRNRRSTSQAYACHPVQFTTFFLPA